MRPKFRRVYRGGDGLCTIKDGRDILNKMNRELERYALQGTLQEKTAVSGRYQKTLLGRQVISKDQQRARPANFQGRYLV
jgi:hypothetical protein